MLSGSGPCCRDICAKRCRSYRCHQHVSSSSVLRTKCTSAAKEAGEWIRKNLSRSSPAMDLERPTIFCAQEIGRPTQPALFVLPPPLPVRPRYRPRISSAHSACGWRDTVFAPPLLASRVPDGPPANAPVSTPRSRAVYGLRPDPKGPLQSTRRGHRHWTHVPSSVQRRLPDPPHEQRPWRAATPTSASLRSLRTTTSVASASLNVDASLQLHRLQSRHRLLDRHALMASLLQERAQPRHGPHRSVQLNIHSRLISPNANQVLRACMGRQ